MYTYIYISQIPHYIAPYNFSNSMYIYRLLVNLLKKPSVAVSYTSRAGAARRTGSCSYVRASIASRCTRVWWVVAMLQTGCVCFSFSPVFISWYFSGLFQSPTVVVPWSIALAASQDGGAVHPTSYFIHSPGG